MTVYVEHFVGREGSGRKGEPTASGSHKGRQRLGEAQGAGFSHLLIGAAELSPCSHDRMLAVSQERLWDRILLKINLLSEEQGNAHFSLI